MKRAQINPGWLVALMTRWASRRPAIGYPTKSTGFSERTSGGYDHSTPMDFCADDYTDLEAALNVLREIKPEQFAAMMMYYKPWVIKSLQAEGHAFGNSTYYQRLHAAHSFVATKLLVRCNDVE